MSRKVKGKISLLLVLLLLLNMITVGSPVLAEGNETAVQYSLSVDAIGQGTTVPSVGEYVYSEGAEVVLEAVPEPGWIFNKWVVGSEEYDNEQITVFMDKNKSAKAYYIESEPEFYTLSSIANRHTSFFDVSKTSVTADLLDKSKITIYLRDSNNSPVGAGVDVYVASDRAVERFYSDSALTNQIGTNGKASFITDANGIVEMWVASTIAGTMKLGVSISDPSEVGDGATDLHNYLQGSTEYTTAQLGLLGTQELNFTAAPPDAVYLSASGSPAIANGREKIILTSSVTDTAGGPVAGQEVTFTVNRTGLTWDKTSYETNAAGQAVAKVSSTKATDFDIRAHAGGKTSTAQNIVFDPLTDAFSITKVDGDNQVVANTYESGWLVVNLKDVHDNNITNTAQIDDITFPTKPTDSNISVTTAVEVHGTNLRFKVTPDKDGEYVIRAFLANGLSANFNMTAQTQGKITGMTISYRETKLPHGQSTYSPIVRWVDANGVGRAAPASSLDWSVSDANLGSVDNNSGVFTATDDTRKKGVVTVSAVDPARSVSATYNLTVTEGPSLMSLEAARALTPVGESVNVTLSLLNNNDEVIGFGAPAAGVARNLTLNVVSKPAGAIVETSQPSAGAVNEALSETGELTFSVSSDTEGEITVVAVVKDDKPVDEKVISQSLTFAFGEEPVIIEDDHLKIDLLAGWNLISVPLQLGPDTIEEIVKDIELVELAFLYDHINATWEEANENTVLNPFDAIYLKMLEPSQASLYPSKNLTGPYTKTFNKGWNLFGPALDISSKNSRMKANDVLYSIDNKYIQVISQRIGEQHAWVYLPTMSDSPYMAAGEGYWIYMSEEASLAGFSYTPVKGVHNEQQIYGASLFSLQDSNKKELLNQEIPSFPVAFFGHVIYDNGDPVSEGTIEVIIDGQVRATKSFTDGYYGLSLGERLMVEQMYYDHADSIQFRVNGHEADHKEVIDWDTASGELLELNLTVTAEAPSELYYQSVTVTAMDTVELTFSKDIFNALDNLEALKNTVEFSPDGESFRFLQEDETIEISSNRLVITIAEELSGEQNKIRLATGSLEDADGNIMEEGVVTEAFDASVVEECFIATAAYGSKLAPGVIILRQFRDAKLLTNLPGQAIVSFYYKVSPPFAELIAGNEVLKILVRTLLLPVIAAAYLVLQPWLLLLAVSLVMLTAYYRRRVYR